MPAGFGPSGPPAGMALNHEPIGPGGVKLAETTTAGSYRLHGLPGTVPPKPALIRGPAFAGPGIAVEVWALPAAAFGGWRASRAARRERRGRNRPGAPHPTSGRAATSLLHGMCASVSLRKPARNRRHVFPHMPQPGAPIGRSSFRLGSVRLVVGRKFADIDPFADFGRQYSARSLVKTRFRSGPKATARPVRPVQPSTVKGPPEVLQVFAGLSDPSEIFVPRVRFRELFPELLRRQRRFRGVFSRADANLRDPLIRRGRRSRSTGGTDGSSICRGI